MTSHKPEARPQAVDVLAHDWMRGTTATKEEFDEKFEQYMTLAKAQ